MSEDNVQAFPAEAVVRNVVVAGFHCSYLNAKVSPSFGSSKSTPTAERLPFR